MSEYNQVVKRVAEYFPYYFEKNDLYTTEACTDLISLYQEKYGFPFVGELNDLKNIDSENVWTHFSVGLDMVFFFKNEENAVVAKLLT